MKWPLVAAYTRAGIADALATITPASSRPGGAARQQRCCVLPSTGTRSTRPGPALIPARHPVWRWPGRLPRATITTRVAAIR